MSALYQMRYLGVAGEGHGAIVIANGKILGVDVMGGRYVGAYAEHGGEIVGQAELTFEAGGTLVTGETLPPGGRISINLTAPKDLGGGRAISVTVGGRQVQVAFFKIGDF